MTPGKTKDGYPVHRELDDDVNFDPDDLDDE